MPPPAAAQRESGANDKRKRTDIRGHLARFLDGVGGA